MSKYKLKYAYKQASFCIGSKRATWLRGKSINVDPLKIITETSDLKMV